MGMEGHSQMTSVIFFTTPPPLSVSNSRNLPSFGQKLANPLPPAAQTSYVHRPLSGVVLHGKGREKRRGEREGNERRREEEHNDRETLQWFSGNAFKTCANMCSVYRVTHLLTNELKHDTLN